MHIISHPVFWYFIANEWLFVSKLIIKKYLKTNKFFVLVLLLREYRFSNLNIYINYYDFQKY